MVDGENLALRVHVVLQDHVQVMQLNIVCRLGHDEIAAAQQINEADCARDLYGVQMRERLQGPNSRRPVE